MTSKLFGVEGVSNSLWSAELAPTEPEERTWNASNIWPVWAATAVSLPVYLFASGMAALGVSVGVIVGSVFAGSLVVVSLAMGCGHAGVRYAIPFAVLARAAFGVTGAKVPLALRLLVGCAWVGIACWLGAQAVFAMLSLIAPLLPPNAIWMCFVLFLLAVAARFGGDWKLVTGVLLGACFLLTLAFALWSELHTRGLGVLAIQPTLLPPSRSSLGHGIALGVTGVVGLWLPVALGASDTGKRIQSQRAQLLSLCVIPLAMVVFSAAASTTAILGMERGLLYWNPVSLAGGITRAMFAGGCLVLLAAVVLLTTRPLCGWLGKQPAELMPAQITPALGRWLVCVLAAVCMPWLLVSSPQRYLGGSLTGCAGLLAPLAVILLVEYFALRHRWLNVDDLYQRDGLYEYSGGWNSKAFGAACAGWAMMLLMFAAPALVQARDGAVWIGTVVSAALYWVLRSGPPIAAQIPPTPLLIPLAGFESEGASG